MVMMMTTSYAMNNCTASTSTSSSEEEELKRQAELDAAQALLGVIECSPTTSTINIATTPMEEEEEEDYTSWPCTASSSMTTQKTLNALDMLASNAAVLLQCEEEELDDGRMKTTGGGGRVRSISNPEGMEKWDSLRRAAFTSARHFIQPTIMEEEENYNNVAVENTTTDPISYKSSLSIEQVKSLSETDVQELLVKARAKLLDDGIIASDRSGLTNTISSNPTSTTTTSGLVLPHALDKYREVYNKNGRIGIYTPSERAAIISRFNSKRARRVWNKKIRYSCRKNLADRRLRIKGRFVKRDNVSTTTTTSAGNSSSNNNNNSEEEDKEMIMTITSTTSETTHLKVGTDGDEEEEEENVNDATPDVDDVEAGFIPTTNQPYRRIRRHTIT